jgi:putative restriction endonuclease
VAQTIVPGWVAVTDPAWLQFMRSLHGLDEINFWRPTATPIKHQLGTPWFFKAKFPVNAIVGGAFFEHYESLPVGAAWEVYGQKNGVPSFEELCRSLNRIRKSPNTGSPRHEPLTPSSMIGCVVLSAPFFLDAENYIATPRDFSPNVVVGKRYDLTSGEGRKLWDSMEAALAKTSQTVQPSSQPTGSAWGEPRLVRPRLGQGGFRFAVLKAYGHRCAVTGERVLPALEAAHIRPFSDVEQHEVQNGLALRSDIHRLFDLGYVTIDNHGTFRVSRSLREDFNGGDDYYKLDGLSVALPDDESERPDLTGLEWHSTIVYRGD